MRTSGAGKGNGCLRCHNLSRSKCQARSRIDLGVLSAESCSIADEALDEIEAVIARIAKQPGMGMRCGKIHPEVRHFSATRFPYVVYYKQVETGIQLARVLHSSRDAQRVLRHEATD